MRTSQILDDLKLLIRTAEGALEILLLATAFDAVWHVAYYGKAFPLSYTAGKELMLLITVYVILSVTVFALCDCFRYGYLN